MRVGGGEGRRRWNKNAWWIVSARNASRGKRIKRRGGGSGNGEKGRRWRSGDGKGFL